MTKYFLHSAKVWLAMVFGIGATGAAVAMAVFLTLATILGLAGVKLEAILLAFSPLLVGAVGLLLIAAIIIASIQLHNKSHSWQVFYQYNSQYWPSAPMSKPIARNYLRIFDDARYMKHRVTGRTINKKA